MTLFSIVYQMQSHVKQQKGMLLSICLIFLPVCFKDAKFYLTNCRLTEDGSKIRTTFETSGTTRWGAYVYLSGVDHFWFAPDSATIVRHQSEWDQPPADIVASFFGRKTPPKSLE